MTGRTHIRLLESITLEENCTSSWSFNDDPPMIFCHQHKKNVSLDGKCSGTLVEYEAGDTVLVDSRQARSLVDAGMAVYPTHAPEKDESVQTTLNQVNRLLESEGLPTLDYNSFSGIKRVTKKNYYKTQATPQDKGLAEDLGLSVDSIAEMRKASKLNQNP